MQFTAEQHLAMAKTLREHAKEANKARCERLIKRSNTCVAAAVLAAENRGGISVSGFDFNLLSPNWSVLDSAISRLQRINGAPQIFYVSPLPVTQAVQEDRHAQVRQLIKQALETPRPEEFADLLNFTTRFRRLAVWNARMAYIQRPGARIIATEHEWQKVGRTVQPDAVPIIILWPFCPIRFVYELEDTGPPIDRESINDPFSVRGEFRAGMLSKLLSSIKKQKKFRIAVEARRQGFSYAGSAAAQGVLPIVPSLAASTGTGTIGEFAHENATTGTPPGTHGVPTFRVTLNDRLKPAERFVTLAHELGHIFCGHLGACISNGSGDDESGWPDRRSLGKNEKEIEAEAVAYLVASRAEVVTGSAVYLKTHAQRADMKSVDVELIVRGAARIERLAKIHYGSMLFR